MKGRLELVYYLESHGFSYEGESKGKYSIDENLFHKSTEGAELEYLESDYNASEIISSTQDTGSKSISVKFENGVPVALNDQILNPRSIVEKLNAIGEKYGIGVVDIVEERVNGIKSRGIYQTPGGTILYYALKKLKEFCWSHQLIKFSQFMGIEYSEFVYSGA